MPVFRRPRRSATARPARLRRTLLSTGAAVCSLALLAGAADAAPTPGKPSIGDPYYPTDGNTGYDAQHYDLRLSYVPGDDRLSGTATILARTTQDLSRFSLDFGLKPSSVLVNNQPARFTSKQGKLTVTPLNPVAARKQLLVVVRYSGVPSTVTINGEQGWLKRPLGALAANEPHSAAFWFPVNDTPRDKASYDVSVAVPKGTEAISNGEFLGTATEPGNQQRWFWRSPRPQAPYLTLLAIGDFEVHNEKVPGEQPFVTAYDRGLSQATIDAAKVSVERTPEIHEFEAGLFGPYPFDQKGGVVADGLNYALETQTRPIFGASFFDHGANTYVVAHENAHQWFGDSVSVHNWRDIWDNEGFASYAEWLWSQHIGEGTAQQLFTYTYAQYPAKDKFWQVLPGDPGAANQFDDAVYDRGAMTLQALRNKVGDKAFFEILRNWTAIHAYSDASVQQFIALAQKISGKNLQALFTTWLFTKGRPAPTAANGFPAGARSFATGRPASYEQIQHTHRLLAGRHG